MDGGTVALIPTFIERLRRRTTAGVETYPGLGPCFLLTGKPDTNGYARIRVGGKQLKAHRASYAEFIGPIPPGLDVCHKCDVRTCWRPSHLFTGTHGDNNRDRHAKGRSSRSMPGCPPEKAVRGERHPKAKLTTAQVLAIRGDPRRQTEIAASHGVSQCHVSRIKRSVAWR